MLPYIYTHIYFLIYFPSLLCLTPTPILCRPLLHILFHTFKTIMVFYFISFHFNIIKSLGSPSTMLNQHGPLLLINPIHLKMFKVTISPTRYLAGPERAKLAYALGMTESQVKV